MCKILTKNGSILIADGDVLTIEQSSGGESSNIQSSKSYTVSASGSQTISPDNGYDGMAAVALTVPSGSATGPSGISESSATLSTGTNTLTLTKTGVSTTPTISAGYVSSATASTATVALTASVNTRSSSDLSASGATVTAPAGYYASDATKTITSGSATPASTITGTGASVSSSSTTLTLSKTVSNTPQVSAGYISSGTSGDSSISLSATDSNFTESNIKKDVSIFGKTGTYEGSSGTVTLTPYTIRPDAELIQSWTDDFLVVTDKNVTIPAYTTTSTTLITGGTALTTKPTISSADYRWYIVLRHLTIPIYSSTTKAAGRQEYTAMSSMYEIVNILGKTAKALVSDTYYASRNVTVQATGNAFIRCVYWSSGSAIKLYTANSYGCAQTINTAPAISSATADAPTITFYTPNVVIRGSSSYLSSTYWGYITDIRCQYKYELYRIPKTTGSTYGISGWGQYNNMIKIMNDAQTTTHKLS